MTDTYITCNVVYYSLVGAIAVVAGLYAVLWGRDNDTETRGDKISGDDGITTPFTADTNNC